MSESSESNSNETVSSRSTSDTTTTTTVPSTTTTRRSSLLNSLGGDGLSNSSNSGVLGRATGGLIRLRRQQVTVDPICFPKNKTPLPNKFDWREKGKVTPARFQVT